MWLEGHRIAQLQLEQTDGHTHEHIPHAATPRGIITSSLTPHPTQSVLRAVNQRRVCVLYRSSLDCVELPSQGSTTTMLVDSVRCSLMAAVEGTITTLRLWTIAIKSAKVHACMYYNYILYNETSEQRTLCL